MAHDVGTQTSTGSRYTVTEIEGYGDVDVSRYSARSRPGLSVHILNTAVLHRCVWSARTEDYGNNTERARDWLRYEAERRCCVLNGAPAPPPFNRWRAGFRPTCPSCGSRCDPAAAYCSCGCNLYRQEIGFSVRATRYGQ